MKSRSHKTSLARVAGLVLALFLVACAVSVYTQWRDRAASGRNSGQPYSPLSLAAAAQAGDPQATASTPVPAQTPATQPAAVPPTSAPAPRDEKTDTGTPEPISFQFLAGYRYNPGDDPTALRAADKPLAQSSIPDRIKALDGKRVEIHGFMLPLDFKNGKTTQFILMAVLPGCFYCQPPEFNQFIVAKMPQGRSAEYAPGLPVRVVGRIAVGEEREGGEVTCIYRLACETVVAEPDPGKK